MAWLSAEARLLVQRERERERKILEEFRTLAIAGLRVTLMLVNGVFDRLPTDSIVNEVKELMANE